jgi:hypothetical protein
MTPYCVCDSPANCRDTNGNLLGDKCELFRAKKQHEQTYGPLSWTRELEEGTDDKLAHKILP